MLDLLVTLAQSHEALDGWLLGALGAIAAFVASMVKWILNFMQRQAKENAKMQEKQLDMRGKEVEINTKLHNTMCDVVEKFEGHMDREEKQTKELKTVMVNNTKAINNLCETLNKRLDTDTFTSDGRART